MTNARARAPSSSRCSSSVRKVDNRLLECLGAAQLARCERLLREEPPQFVPGVSRDDGRLSNTARVGGEPGHRRVAPDLIDDEVAVPQALSHDGVWNALQLLVLEVVALAAEPVERGANHLRPFRDRMRRRMEDPQGARALQHRLVVHDARDPDGRERHEGPLVQEAVGRIREDHVGVTLDPPKHPLLRPDVCDAPVDRRDAARAHQPAVEVGRPVVAPAEDVDDALAGEPEQRQFALPEKRRVVQEDEDVVTAERLSEHERRQEDLGGLERATARRARPRSEARSRHALESTHRAGRRRVVAERERPRLEVEGSSARTPSSSPARRLDP